MGGGEPTRLDVWRTDETDAEDGIAEGGSVAGPRRPAPAGQGSSWNQRSPQTAYSPRVAPDLHSPNNRGKLSINTPTIDFNLLRRSVIEYP